MNEADGFPLIDDRYWLARGRDAVSAVPRQLEDAARTLTTAVAWFWSVYTGGTIVGTAISDRLPSTVATVLMAIPSPLLLLAYLTAARCLLPDIEPLVVNAPELIEERLLRGVALKRRQLRRAETATFLAGLATATGVLVQALG